MVHLTVSETGFFKTLKPQLFFFLGLRHTHTRTHARTHTHKRKKKGGSNNAREEKKKKSQLAQH